MLRDTAAGARVTAVSSEATYFGPADRPLFGWLHRPGSTSPTGLGVVLCNPLGHEALSSHRTYRLLADAIAAIGLPVLRFDYDGTGDSAGSDFDPDRPAHWVESVREAVRYLRASTGATRVCLVGLRMGALLSLKAALEDPAVRALVAVEPVSEGRRYLRELTMLAATSQRARKTGATAGAIESAAGFLTTESTREQLRAMALDAAPFRHDPPRVLLLQRTDLPADETVAVQFRKLGCAVDPGTLAGYAEMMLDPHFAVVPMAMIADVTRWLNELAQALPAPGTAATHAFEGSPESRRTAPVGSCPSGASVTEEIVRLHVGEGPPLFGIISHAVSSKPGPAPILVLANSGAVHHVGPHRLYVQIARACAAAGVAVLRIDLVGLGDTAGGANENVVYPGTAVGDLARVHRYCESHFDIQRIYCAGICSGAYHSLKAAAAGQRYAGVVLVNPLTFHWKPGRTLKHADFEDMTDAMRYRRNATRVSSWLKLIYGDVNLGRAARSLSTRLVKRALSTARDAGRRVGIRLPNDLAAELARVVAQGTQVVFLFSDDEPGQPMLREQAGSVLAALEARGDVRLHAAPGADHTFSDPASQTRLVSFMLRELQRGLA